MSIEEAIFKSQTFGTLKFSEMMDETKRFIARDPDRFYKIIIGTDSNPAVPTVLVTAITIWRVGNGAIHFWTESERRMFHSMRERVWQEAINSITLAQELRGHLREHLGEDFFWEGNEIHVDMGEKGPTKEFVESVIGMIKGYDFLPVIKPYAFGASVVADRHT
ncbi:MAG: hypothetical protein HYT37_03280 [Candidatus Sungbacteria bacterium]|nr:hypothetical protein [Candidatus Sungbacteria bacterium]